MEENPNSALKIKQKIMEVSKVGEELKKILQI